MTTRALFTALLVAALLLAGVTPAAAWSNGGDADRAYGPHDWMLDRARTMAGSPAWLNRRVALYATNDPDDARNPWLNDYQLQYESGIRRGAAQKVADLYYAAVQAYKAGNYTAASRYVGQLSHCYGDILQPFHAARAARDMQKIHLQYEYAFGDYFRSHRSAVDGWVVKRTPRPVTNVRDRVIAAAAYSRAYYPALYQDYRANRRISGTTKSVTRRMMNFGVNEFADLIRSIPQAAGMAPQTATMTAWMKYPYMSQGFNACVYVKCLDAEGKPVNSAKVVISWPKADGSVTKVVAYTDPNGIAHDYEKLGTVPYLRSMPVTAVQTTSGKTARAATSYMVTPALHSTSGITMSVAHDVSRDSTVTATVQLRDVNLRPVADMPVTLKWCPTSDYGPPYLQVSEVLTDIDGKARVPWFTGSSSRTVFVKAETSAAGTIRGAWGHLHVW